MAGGAEFLVRVRTVVDNAGLEQAARQALAEMQRIQAAAKQFTTQPLSNLGQLGSFGQEVGTQQAQIAGIRERAQYLQGQGVEVNPQVFRDLELATRGLINSEVRAAETFTGLQNISDPAARMERVTNELIRAEDRGARAHAEWATATEEAANLTRQTSRRQARVQAAPVERTRPSEDPNLVIERMRARAGARQEALDRSLSDTQIQQARRRAVEATREQQLLDRSYRAGAVDLHPTPRSTIAQEGRADVLRQDEANRRRIAGGAFLDSDRDLRDAFVETAGQTRAESTRRNAEIRSAAAREARANEQVIAAMAQRTQEERRTATAVRAYELGIRREAAESDEVFQARVAAESRLALAEERRARNEAERAAIGRVTAGRPELQGTFFQRIQQSISSRSGQEPRLPTEFQTLRQFLTSRALTTAGFALSGAALYGSIQGIRTLVTEAENLERIFNQVQAQFESIGEGDQFNAFRQNILAIARDTGQASDEVAFVAFQMKGAFGDSAEAINATNQAIRITKVTGLDLTETIDSLTAAWRSYGLTGDSLTKVGDIALGTQERLGVLAKETIKGVADLAPVAKQAGLSLEQTFAIVGVAQQVSGRAGSAISEAYGRIIPAMSQNSFQIATIFRQNQALTGSYDELIRAIGAGNMGAVLDLLIRRWSDLDSAQQDQIITSLGGRREAQALISVLENSDRYVKTLNGSMDDAGKTAAYFADLQQTLAQRLARLRTVFTQLGEALFRAGLADALKGIVEIGSLALNVIAGLTRGFASFNQFLGGFPGRMIAAVAAVALMTRGLEALQRAKMLTGVTGALTGGAAGLGRGGLIDVARTGGMYGAEAAAAGGAGILGRGIGYAGGGLGALGGALGISTTTLGVGLLVAGALSYKTAAEAQAKKEEAFRKAIQDRSKYTDEALETLAASDEKYDDATVYEKIRHFPSRFTDTALNRRRSKQNTAVGEINRRATTDLRRNFKDVQDAFIGFRREDIQKQLEEWGKSGSLDAVFNDLGDTPRTGALSQADVQEIIKGAERGDTNYLNVIDAALEAKQSTANGAKEIRFYLNRARTKRDAASAKKYVEGAGDGDVAAALQDADALKQAFQSGAITIREYLNGLDNIQQDYRNALALGGKLSPEAAKRFEGNNKDSAAAYAKALTDSQAILTQIESGGASNNLTALTSRASMLSARLRDPKFTDRDARIATAKEIVDVNKAIRDLRIKNADSAADVQKILDERSTIDPLAKVSLLGEFVRSSQQWLDFVATAANFFGNQATTTQALLNAAVDGNITLTEAAVRMIDDQIAYLQGLFNTPGLSDARLIQLGAQINALRNLRNTASGLQSPQGFGTGDDTNAGGLTEAEQRAYDERKAAIQKRRAQANGDPVKLAQLDKEQAALDMSYARTLEQRTNAETEAIQAQQAADQARTQIALARIDLLKAQTRDPARLAELELEAANIALAAAHDDESKIRALIQKAQAEEQAYQAQRATVQANSELQQAMANFRGDSVGAAEIELQLARDNLNAAIAHKGTDPNEVTRLRGEQINAEGRLRDETLRKREADIDFRQQAQLITTQQAIAEYQAILDNATVLQLTEDQQRELYLKIKQLRDGLNANLSFDVPSDIKLPTLYEIRRTRGALEGSGSYNDNRQVTVYMTNNNATDYQGSIDRIGDELANAPRYATGGRVY